MLHHISIQINSFIYSKHFSANTEIKEEHLNLSTVDLLTGWEHIAGILCKQVLPVLEVSNIFQCENIADWDDKTCPVIKTLKKDLVLVP